MSSIIDQTVFNNDLLTFLRQSPTPFHAVASMKQRLEASGFEALEERDAWQLTSGHRYYVTRNDSSIIAFHYTPDAMLEQGIRMLGAHTDSPALKVKPQPEIIKQGYGQLGVETYGGALLAPWFDRDLSIAGRVNYRNQQGELQSKLINFERAVAFIPSLAIHLNREANSGNKINAQKHLPPVLFQTDNGFDFRDLLAQELSRTGVNDCEKVFDYELFLYDTQAPAIIGLNNEFINSARLDNLLSCYIGLQAILAANPTQPALLVCNDHEEVGSASACGAQGPMLEQCLQRLLADTESRLRVIDRSVMVSADNAHGIHPNYAELHDPKHGPLLNKGPVIKVNANQRYATNSDTSSLIKHLSERENLPVQEFVTRSDLGCGSTIGPITATEVGVKTIDMGVPTFGMHSIRETAGVTDSHLFYQLLTAFLNN